MDTQPDERRESDTPEKQPAPGPVGKIEYRPETTVETRAALMVQADNVALNKGVAGAIVANEAHVNMGGSWLSVAQELNVDRGGSQWLIASDARLHQAGSGIVIARHADLTDARVGVLLAGNVNGDVQTMLDRESALRFGAAFGLVLGVSLIIRRLVR